MVAAPRRKQSRPVSVDFKWPYGFPHWPPFSGRCRRRINDPYHYLWFVMQVWEWLDFKVIFQSTFFYDKNRWAHLFYIFIDTLLISFFQKPCEHDEHNLEACFNGVRTLRHQDTSAPRQFSTKQLVPKRPDTSAPNFFGAEVSRGHFGLVLNCLGAEVSWSMPTV